MRGGANEVGHSRGAGRRRCSLEPVEDYSDERMRQTCLFCGGDTNTRDHCPSRVFLDPPYPAHLPHVGCCKPCNASFSLDEEYTACLIEAVIVGSADPSAIRRPNVARALERGLRLRARIERAMHRTETGIVFTPEEPRVQRVVAKLARGHALYELAEVLREEPEEIFTRPLLAMSGSHLDRFEKPVPAPAWPEVGSRAMQRLTESQAGPWLVVQPGNYRYCATVGNGIEVRIVIREYLACYARWP